MFKQPLVAIFGLPNSGKSTLLNRLCGFRKAIVADQAHTTRDLNYGEDIWENMYIRFVDTGGLVPNPNNTIEKMVQIKSWAAITKADLLLWVIDCKQNPDTISLDVMQSVWQTGKPFIIGINKVDHPNQSKDISQYAKLGGLDFINFSAANGYNLNELMDMLVLHLQKLGFEINNWLTAPEEPLERPSKKERKVKTKLVRKNQEGDNYIVMRESTEQGPGLYYTLSQEEAKELENLYGLSISQKPRTVNKIDTLVFDFGGVLFYPLRDSVPLFLQRELQLSQEEVADIKEKMPIFDPNQIQNILQVSFWQTFVDTVGLNSKIQAQKIVDFVENDQTLVPEVEQFLQANFDKYLYYYLTNAEKKGLQKRLSLVSKYFKGGLADSDIDYQFTKPDLQIYQKLIEQEGLDPEKSIFIDDRPENVQAAREMGFWGIEYKIGETNLEREIQKIKLGQVKRKSEIPKVLFIGRPNVGKSSIFNAMVGEDIQIVTDVAGTTLSLNDILVERIDKDQTKIHKKI